MRLFHLLTLSAALSCLAAVAPARAQSGRVKRTDPPKSERGDADRQGTDEKDGQHGKADGRKGDAQPDANGVYRGSEVTRRARIKSKPLPSYPREARSKGVVGVVRLRLILRADGRVDDHIEVLSGLPYGITEEAIRVAKKIEFEPAEKDGRKVATSVLVEYNFNIY